MLKRLLRELRRRRVPQVAGFYLAAGWVLFEVADGTFPRLGLPDWTVTLVLVLLLLGLPLVVGLAWIFDIEPGGVRRTPPADGVAQRSERRGKSADALSAVATSASSAAFGRIAVIGAVLVLALAGGAFVLFGGGEVEPAMAPDAMVVLPFTVRGGEDVDVLAEGMVELLSAKLDGLGELRSADPHVVLSRVSGDVHASEARALARRLGAGHYVQGSVLEFGGELRLQASVYETDGRTAPVASASVEGTTTSFLALVDELAAELLVAGELAPPGRMPRIAALTTEDLGALRYFLRGETALRETRYEEAVPLFERAVEADSAFALAYYRMSVAASWLERAELLERSLAAAQRHGDRLGERDRALVRAFAARKAGRHAEAAERYRAILRSFPDDLEAWYELGEVVLHRGAFLGITPEDAKPVFERAVELDPAYGAALYHLSNIAAWERELPLLDSTTRALRAQRDGGDAGPDIEAQWAFATEDSAGLERTLASIRAREEPFTAVFAAWNARDGAVVRRVVRASEATPNEAEYAIPEAEALAHELVGRGVRDEALAWLEREEEGAGEAPVRTAVLAAMPFVRTPPRELTRLRDRLRDWDPGPIRMEQPGPEDWAGHAWGLPHLRLYLMALLEARLGRSGEALRLAGELKQLDGIPEVRALAADMALHVRAQVAMDQGLMAEALRLVREASFWEASPWDERFSAVLFHAAEVNLRAEALQAMGRYREAIRWHSMVTFGANRGYSHYRRAQAFEALGEPDQAAAHYAEFLRLWTDADPDLSDLVGDARRRLEAMAAER